MSHGLLTTMVESYLGHNQLTKTDASNEKLAKETRAKKDLTKSLLGGLLMMT
jgi:hypothetical protein